MLLTKAEAREYGERSARNRRNDIYMVDGQPMTVQQIADAIGVVPLAINKLRQKLRRNGLPLTIDNLLMMKRKQHGDEVHVVDGKPYTARELSAVLHTVPANVRLRVKRLQRIAPGQPMTMERLRVREETKLREMVDDHA